MSKYIVDFEFAGHVEVEARTEKQSKEIVESMDAEKLLKYVQNFNVGKYYIEKQT